ncbi:fasciclin domain-containing protein [Thalassotalea aquiviva]|uniref:fasciclin domain-containing protein n=1 Tax=Thalassotalea aquiviva TaxID=3242415 RepID=UPI00352A8E0F
MEKLTKLLLVTLTFFLITACDDDDDSSRDTPETIVEVASSNDNFTILVAALEATGLDSTLSNPDAEFTVFAPTDAAFEKLGTDTINALLADPDTLSNILTYHVLSGTVLSDAAIASAGSTVATVNGDSIGLSLNGNELLVNTSTVTQTDVITDNGVIHVIDAVLLPPQLSANPTMNIVDTAVSAGQFTTLVSLLQATGLDTVLADESMTYTVFAPTDTAFSMIDQETLQLLLNNPDVLKNILLQHVVPGAVDSVRAYSLNGSNATTASEAEIALAVNAMTDMLTFGDANVVTKDVNTTNGIIHVIDAVVIADVALPEPAMSIVDVAVGNGNFTTLVAALQATGLDTVLADLETDYTVFAPTDEAFALLGQDTINALLNDTEALSNILLYHVVSGAKVMSDGAVGVAQSDSPFVDMANQQSLALSFNNSMLYANQSLISGADVMADNGVIHVVDQVILPPEIKQPSDLSIVDVALANEDFSTLVTALTAADLVTTLADEQQTFTVFAPTNAAFAKIPTDTLNALLGDTAALSQVLLQHVVSGAEISSTTAFAANGTSVNTAANDDVSVSLVNFTKASNTSSDEVAYDATQQILVGGQGSAKPGFSLYVFDNDLGSSGSVCNDACATNWPPVLVTDNDVSNIEGLSVVTRDDGSLQAAYLGRPLYYFINDTQAGDQNGQGVIDKWWLVNLPQVSLQIQGSNVITKDIYTSNGVIHVIDTVITETLAQ